MKDRLGWNQIASAGVDGVASSSAGTRTTVDVKWTFDELTNIGVSGDPTKGTLAKGKKMRKVLVDAIVKVLTDLKQENWDYRSPEVK